MDCTIELIFSSLVMPSCRQCSEMRYIHAVAITSKAISLCWLKVQLSPDAAAFQKIVTSRDVGNADTGLHAEKLDLNERVADELSMRVKVLVVSTVKLGS
jgi:hypothetical protein